MVEKQASSEIAQSREDEKFASDFVDVFGGFPKDQAISLLVRRQREIWQQAERDTRARVAQLARDIAKEVGGNFADTHRLNVGLNKFIKELERIRGKE